MEGMGSYNKIQSEKYQNPSAVKEKWIRIFRNINPYTNPSIILNNVREAFTLVECVMKNILSDYHNAYVTYGVLVPNTRNTYEFSYQTGKVVINFDDHSAYAMTKALRAIGYNLPEEINDTRKLRNFLSHNLETFTVDYFRDNMSYDSIIKAMYNLGQSLVEMRMLNHEDIIPSFDELRIRVGDVVGLSDEFEVERFIVKSGSSRLYEGRHKRLDKAVAIKELLPNTFSDILLNNEKDLLVSLKHPRIPDIYDVFNQNGTFYIVMEYIDGVGLDEYIKQNKCTLEEKLKIIYDICDVTNYLHSTKGMVHADLKPQNVMIDKNNNVNIIDFGTAHDNNTKNRLRGVSMGYTAPEVTSGLPTDYKIDIYSIGAIINYLFNEELDNSLINYCEKTEKIRSITKRCMEYYPQARYNSVVEIQSEIDSILYNREQTEMYYPTVIENMGVENSGFSIEKYNELVPYMNYYENTQMGTYNYIPEIEGNSAFLTYTQKFKQSIITFLLSMILPLLYYLCNGSFYWEDLYIIVVGGAIISSIICLIRYNSHIMGTNIIINFILNMGNMLISAIISSFCLSVTGLIVCGIIYIPLLAIWLIALIIYIAYAGVLFLVDLIYYMIMCIVEKTTKQELIAPEQDGLPVVISIIIVIILFVVYY